MRRVGSSVNGFKSKYMKTPNRRKPFEWQNSWMQLEAGDVVELGWKDEAAKSLAVVRIIRYDWVWKKLYYDKVYVWETDVDNAANIWGDRLSRHYRQKGVIITRNWMKMRKLTENEVIAYAI